MRASLPPLTDGTLTNPIDRDALGAAVSGTAWSNVDSDGTHVSTNPLIGACDGWTTDQFGGNTSGRVGIIGNTDSTWTEASNFTCSIRHHLYCFQQ